MLCAVLEVKTGALTFCNAGHPSPFLLSSAGAAPLDTQKNVALGAMPGLSYQTATTRLAPGDGLFFYTDGVTEALDAHGHFYDSERLQTALRAIAALPVEKITPGVVTDVRTFCGEREQSDDISVMALRWLGPPALA